MAKEKLFQVVENIVDWTQQGRYIYAELPQGVRLLENIPYKKASETEQEQTIEQQHEQSLETEESEKVKLKLQNQANLLDIIYPAVQLERYPVVINIHGGAFAHNTKNRGYRDYAVRLAGDMFVVVNANYRLSQEAIFPAQIQDMLDILRFVEQNAAEYSFDTSRVFLIGDSAGAYLSAMTECVLTNEALRKYYEFDTTIQVKAIALNSGMFDFTTFLGPDSYFPFKKEYIYQFFGSSEIEQTEHFQYSSVFSYVTGKFCPTYIMDTDMLSFAAEARRLARCLKEHKVKHVLHIYSRKKMLIHAFNTYGKYPESAEVLQETFAFFHKHLNDLAE